MSKHPTDDIPRPEHHRLLGNDVYGKEYPCYTADQLRALLIKAYDMGRENEKLNVAAFKTSIIHLEEMLAAKRDTQTMTGLFIYPAR